MFGNKKNLTIKYYDLWQATFMNLLTQAGIENVVDASILNKTDELMKNAIKNTQDVVFHHNKLMEMRGA